MSARQWSGKNVQAYLVFQPQPPCFNAEQWADWKHYALAATLGVGNNGGIGTIDLPPHCSDCTRHYQKEMRGHGLCAHPEVKFLGGSAYTDVAARRID